MPVGGISCICIDRRVACPSSRKLPNTRQTPTGSGEVHGAKVAQFAHRNTAQYIEQIRARQAAPAAMSRMAIRSHSDTSAIPIYSNAQRKNKTGRSTLGFGPP